MLDEIQATLLLFFFSFNSGQTEYKWCHKTNGNVSTDVVVVVSLFLFWFLYNFEKMHSEAEHSTHKNLRYEIDIIHSRHICFG